MIFKKLLVNLIKKYQKYISPRLSPACVFIPTCSEYAISAFEKYGIFKGGALSLWRILRCNPWQKKHFDPLT